MGYDLKVTGPYLVMNVIGLVRTFSKPNAAKMISKGNEHYRKGELGPAMESYNKAIQLDHDNQIAWNNKGLILTIVGEYDKALECHKRALEIDDNYIDALSNIGMIYAKLERYKEALKYYDSAIEIQPDHETAWNNKGNLMAKMERFEDAINCYDKALEIDPNYVAALNNKSVALAHMKRYEASLEIITKVLEERPTFAEAWYIKGKSFIGMRKFDKAIVCFERALRLNPEFQRATRALQVLQKRIKEEAGKTTKSRTAVKPEKMRTAEIEAKVEEDLKELGMEMTVMEGEYEHLDEHLNEEEKVVFNSISDEPITRHGLKKLLKGKISIAAMEQSLKILGKKGLITSDKRGRATDYMRSETLGPLEEEIVDLKVKGKKGLKPIKMSFHELVEKGRRQAKNGRHKGALTIYKKALKINPYDESTLCLKARSHYELGEVDKSINTILKVLKSKPNSIMAWTTLASAAMSKKDYNDAADCYRKILEINPKNTEADKNLKKCLKALDK